MCVRACMCVYVCVCVCVRVCLDMLPGDVNDKISSKVVTTWLSECDLLVCLWHCGKKFFIHCYTVPCSCTMGIYGEILYKDTCTCIKDISLGSKLY